MPRPLSAAPLCFGRDSEVLRESYSLWRDPQRVVMTVKENAHRSRCPMAGTLYMLNKWQLKWLPIVALSKSSNSLSPSFPIWKMVMVTSTVQVATGLQEYMYGCWHTVGPPPVGAVAIITHEKEQSQGVYLALLWNVYTGAFALEVGLKGLEASIVGWWFYRHSIGRDIRNYLESGPNPICAQFTSKTGWKSFFLGFKSLI